MRAPDRGQEALRDAGTARTTESRPVCVLTTNPRAVPIQLSENPRTVFMIEVGRSHTSSRLLFDRQQILDEVTPIGQKRMGRRVLIQLEIVKK